MNGQDFTLKLTTGSNHMESAGPSRALLGANTVLPLLHIFVFFGGPKLKPVTTKHLFIFLTTMLQCLRLQKINIRFII